MADVPRPDPVVRRIAVRDVAEAFAAGLRDFQAAPLFGLFFGGIYALGGLTILLCLTRFSMPYLAYPLAAGFALIGPFAAVGLYEVSRRRELAIPLSWGGVLGVVLEQHKRELGWMAFVTLFVTIMWLYQVRLLLALFLGFQSFASFSGFLNILMTTPEGLMFLAIGNVVGAVLATALFSLTVVSFPLLLDREVDFVTAMITSVRAVVTNPVPMLGFAAIVVALAVIAMLPAFLGLVVIMPILGHATWHLYRSIVAPAP
ncbi:MAG TPA: DUF2189 domain-containing protein [Bosea sp. (in: a-proteobacteria)]|nr:DUF2189 domain-containing protein [Bosea sp. (in: a-proteobacteria)]